MKLVLGVLLLFSFIVPRSVKAADVSHTIVSFSELRRDEIKQEAAWTVCGNYFASRKLTSGNKILHFAYPGNKEPVLDFFFVDNVTPDLDAKADRPEVIIRNGDSENCTIRLNWKDFKALLRCLSHGVDI